MTFRRSSEEGKLPDDMMAKEVAKTEKLWRISSLTASVDEDTKILVLPLPESKREVKVADTKYETRLYKDLVETVASVDKSLSTDSGQESTKRFDDKTPEEMQDEMARKRKQ